MADAQRIGQLIGKASHGHWKTTTFIAALRPTSLTAPRVLDGPINGEGFRAWIEEFLLPPGLWRCCGHGQSARS
jgi:hypothetical protein